MAYHEQLWIIAGSATPVISLAAIVAGNQTNDLMSRWREMAAQPSTRAYPRAGAAYAASFALWITVLTQAAMFFVAMLSLANEQDELGVTLTVVITGGGLVLNAAAALSVWWGGAFPSDTPAFSLARHFPVEDADEPQES
jgi:hypothetical protein